MIRTSRDGLIGGQGVHEFQRLTGAVEHAAHVDVPALKPVLVAEIGGDTEELAAWGDHMYP
jgi:hypothetical protein